MENGERSPTARTKRHLKFLLSPALEKTPRFGMARCTSRGSELMACRPRIKYHLLCAGVDDDDDDDDDDDSERDCVRDAFPRVASRPARGLLAA